MIKVTCWGIGEPFNVEIDETTIKSIAPARNAHDNAKSCITLIDDHYWNVMETVPELLANGLMATFDECVASGASCSYKTDGPNGEMQCKYCGKGQPS